MGQFLGWASYDIKWRCDHCGEECDPEEAHEHDDCEEEDGLRDGAVLKREEGEDLLAVDEGARFGSKGDVLGDDLGARRPVCVDKDEVLRRATSIGRHDSG